MLRIGDTVMVIAGKERGKSGKILQIFRDRDRAIVERLNLVKRHERPSQKHRQGGIIEKESSIHISNLMVFCAKCQKPVRTRIRPDEKKDENKKERVRVCHRCGEKVGV